MLLGTDSVDSCSGVRFRRSVKSYHHGARGHQHTGHGATILLAPVSVDSITAGANNLLIAGCTSNLLTAGATNLLTAEATNFLTAGATILQAAGLSNLLAAGRHQLTSCEGQWTPNFQLRRWRIVDKLRICKCSGHDQPLTNTR